jgi:predicted nucleic acid-binding protein
MITAVDTNILIDVLQQRSKATEALSLASSEGQLIICEIVYAEMCAGMDMNSMEGLSKDLGIKLIHSSQKSLALAGGIWRLYKSHHSAHKGRVLADFIVAAHAITHGDRLLTSDRGFYRLYFKDLVLLQPAN